MINFHIMLLTTAALVYGRKFDNEIEMVADIINSYEKPTSVLVYDCWTLKRSMGLIYKLTNLMPPITIQFFHNIEVFSNTAESKDLIIVADLNCPTALNILKQASATKKLRNPYRWLLIDKNVEKNKIPDALDDLSILFDSEVILSRKDGHQFTLNLIYKLKSILSDWKTESFGIWTSRGFNKSKSIQESSAISRRKNLEGMSIGVSVVVGCEETKTEVLTFNFKLNDFHIDLASKSAVQLVDPLFGFMNATRVVLFTDTWGYGANGTFNGMIGDLITEAADLSGTILFITKARLSILEYLTNPSKTEVMFVFRQPSLSLQNNLFVLPFKPEVWLCTLGVIAVMMFILSMNARWENIKLGNNDDSQKRTSPRLDMGEIAMMLIGAITQQGSFTEMKGTLGRIVMFLMLFLFLFLYTSYSANIVALLQSTSNEIKTLTDLLNSKMELGVEDTQYNRHYFSTATEPVRKAIYDKKIAPRGQKPKFMSLEEGVKAMQKKPFAFNMNIGGGYRFVEKFFLEHEKCGLQEIQYLQQNKPWLICKKNAPLRKLYKIGFRRTHEHGLNDRVNRQMYSKKPPCIASGGTFGSVNMTDFYPALLTLLYGMILSVVLLLLEIIHFHRYRMCRAGYITDLE